MVGERGKGKRVLCFNAGHKSTDSVPRRISQILKNDEVEVEIEEFDCSFQSSRKKLS